MKALDSFMCLILCMVHCKCDCVCVRVCVCVMFAVSHFFILLSLVSRTFSC